MKMKALLVAACLAAALAIGNPALAADKIDINNATVKELQSVKGIGAKTATAIVEYRTKNGDFKSVDELVKVKGIGKRSLQQIGESLMVATKQANK